MKQEKRIVVRGGGDLATGTIHRLWSAGLRVLVLEAEHPAAIRRQVSLCEAVYEGETTVEGLRAVRVASLAEADAVWAQNAVPVLVDPKGSCLAAAKPAVLVDAIIAKKNIGTKITDAPLVVGIGPGFTSGVDCHFCVESNRGHDMGRTLYEGSPEPDTATPGNVGGFSGERIIRATADGIWHPVVKITDVVEKGQLVAYAGEEPVYANMGGIVRGMLPEGTPVTKGLKSGDIDARCKIGRAHV